MLVFYLALTKLLQAVFQTNIAGFSNLLVKSR